MKWKEALKRICNWTELNKLKWNQNKTNIHVMWKSQFFIQQINPLNPIMNQWNEAKSNHITHTPFQVKQRNIHCTPQIQLFLLLTFLTLAKPTPLSPWQFVCFSRFGQRSSLDLWPDNSISCIFSQNIPIISVTPGKDRPFDNFHQFTPDIFRVEYHSVNLFWSIFNFQWFFAFLVCLWAVLLPKSKHWQPRPLTSSGDHYGHGTVQSSSPHHTSSGW